MPRALQTRRTASALLAVLVLLGLSGTAVYAAVVKQPGFTVAVTQSSQNIAQGQSATYNVAVTPSNGFTGTVALAVSGLPAGAGGTFTPASVAVSGTKAVPATMTVTTPPTVVDGSYTLQIKGTSGSTTATTSTKLTITGFSLSGSPTSDTVAPGQTARYSLAISRTASGGPLTLSASGLPQGATATFSPASTAGSSSALAVTTTAATASGSYPLTISGTSGGATRTTTVQLVVTSAGTYTLSAAPAAATVLPGSSATFDVTVDRSGFPEAVTLSASGLPAGGAVTFGQNPVTGSSTTMRLTTAADTEPGSYTVTVSGQGGFIAPRTTTVELVVTDQGMPFAISGNPVGLLAPGISRPVDLTLTNSNDQPLQVTDLTVALDPSSFTAGCTAENFAVTPFDAAAYPQLDPVPAGQTATLTALGAPPSALPQVSMIETGTNQDACQAVELKLSYTGTGQGA